MVQWYHSKSTERTFLKRNKTIEGILKKMDQKYSSLTAVCFMLLKKVGQTFPLAFRKFRVRVRQGDGLNSSFLIRSPWLMKTYELKQCTRKMSSPPYPLPLLTEVILSFCCPQGTWCKMLGIIWPFSSGSAIKTCVLCLENEWASLQMEQFWLS